jgi:putative membrane protein
MNRGARWWVCVGLAASTGALAHAPQLSEDSSWPDLLAVVFLLLASGGLYASGIRRLWRGASRAGVHWSHVAAFATGWIALACALLPPLDPLGAELFSMHMVQHEVLMLIAAPLLILGKPLPVFLWAFALRGREMLARCSRTGWIRKPWQVLTQPLTAWSLHGVAVWVWHAPQLFDAALSERLLHDAQHLSFVITALLFWSALLQARAHNVGAAVLYLFTTTIHTSVLGALITFAHEPWYHSYLLTAPHWGFAPLEDQQLGGLIMWVPGSLAYVGFGLYLFARWIQPMAPAGSTPVARDVRGRAAG